MREEKTKKKAKRQAGRDEAQRAEGVEKWGVGGGRMEEREEEGKGRSPEAGPTRKIIREVWMWLVD